MSSQKDGLLQTNHSYRYQQQNVQNHNPHPIDPTKFTLWQKDYMYKSSYAHFHSKDSTQPKVATIPKYTGHIPYAKSQNIFGKGFTATSKQCFANPKLGKNLLGLSTNGFNVYRDAFVDHSQVATSSKYGKSSIQKAHPSWNEPQRKSTSHYFYLDPRTLPSPTFRQTDKNVQTQKPFTKSSGYATNNSEMDGYGWIPDKKLSGDLNRTEYRDRYNPKVDFHRNTFVSKQRKLKTQEHNYKFN